MANTWDIGDTIRLTATFKNASDTETDPTTVTLTVLDPSGNLDSYTYGAAEITKSATGVYYKDVSIDEAGTWNYRFVGTGDVATAAEELFYVREQRTTA